VEDRTDTHTEITVAKIESVQFNYSIELLGPFTNGRLREDVGDYLLPVEFLMATGESFTSIHTSPSKACLRVAMGMETPPPRGRVYYIQQVPFECKVELKDHTRVDIAANRVVVAQATFDPYTGGSFCKLLPVTDSPSSAELLSVRDALRLSLTVVPSIVQGKTLPKMMNSISGKRTRKKSTCGSRRIALSASCI